MRCGCDADERHSRRASRPRIVHRVADKNQLAARLPALNGMQPIRRWFSFRHVVRTDDWIEAKLRRETLQRNVRFITKPPRENCQFVTTGQSIKQPCLRKPALAENQPVAIL